MSWLVAVVADARGLAAVARVLVREMSCSAVAYGFQFELFEQSHPRRNAASASCLRGYEHSAHDDGGARGRLEGDRRQQGSPGGGR